MKILGKSILFLGLTIGSIHAWGAGAACFSDDDCFAGESCYQGQCTRNFMQTIQAQLTASSVCEVFINPSDNPEKRYETVTTCDGKRGAVVEFDDMTVGTVAPFTKAVQAVLQQGYTLVNCSGIGVDAACYLVK